MSLLSHLLSDIGFKAVVGSKGHRLEPPWLHCMCGSCVGRPRWQAEGRAGKKRGRCGPSGHEAADAEFLLRGSDSSRYRTQGVGYTAGHKGHYTRSLVRICPTRQCVGVGQETNLHRKSNVHTDPTRRSRSTLKALYQLSMFSCLRFYSLRARPP